MKKTLLTVGIVLFLATGGLLYYFYSLPAPVRTDNPADPGPMEITSLTQGEKVGEKFTVSGRAYAAWFQEGKIGIDLIAPDGSLIWTGYAFGEGDWTTDTTLPFSADIDAGSYRGNAVVQIIRDNPSEDPAYDSTYSIPVVIQ